MFRLHNDSSLLAEHTPVKVINRIYYTYNVDLFASAKDFWSFNMVGSLKMLAGFEMYCASIGNS